MDTGGGCAAIHGFLDYSTDGRGTEEVIFTD